jgi:formamidopyrimidine-DNA glycosylase
MPELPEVEHAAVCLRRWLRGGTIVRAQAEPSRAFRGTSRPALLRKLRGRRLLRVERRGKILLLHFDGSVGLLSHLGMTGKWVRRRRGEPGPTHSRLRLFLSNGDVVHYRDPRLFGRLSLHREGELDELPVVRALGQDPLVDGVDGARLHASLSSTARAVKVALMDQRVVAGLGNIQATEALFRAGIHPARRAKSVPRREATALARAIDASICFALEQEGEEEIVYVEEDAGANPFLVYGRAGEPCPKCGRELQKMRLGGRTTVYCERCQR